MMPAGSINVWTCEDCGGHTVAVHVDDGVTPMFLVCRATPGCNGRGVSAGYPAPPVPSPIGQQLAWEWYRPGRRWTRRQEPAMRDHVERGGLVLRPLTDAGRAAQLGLAESATTDGRD